MRDEAATELDAPLAAPPRAVLCDLDGCLIAGDRLLPGAAEFARAAGSRLWIVSNNSSDTEATLAARLRGLGLQVAEARILLAGVRAVERLAAARPGAAVELRAAAPLRARAEALGLRLDAARPEAVLICRDPDFDLAALARVAALMHGGAALFAANADGSHPGPDGVPAPETGAWLAALAAVVPGAVPEVTGKPGPALYRAALARAGVAPEEALFVGDNPATDAAGARALGIPCRIVAPGGLARLAREIAEARP